MWGRAPRGLRLWLVRRANARFTVTVGCVARDGRGRVLLFNHLFRKGSGWGVPGGFINRGEQPEQALRRELCEEAGVELDEAEVAFIRTHRRPQQVEIIYRCRVRGDGAQTPRSRSVEIESAGWFKPEELPQGLSRDQRRIIRRALEGVDARRPE